MSCAANFLKRIYVKRPHDSNKTIHVYSIALKATLAWHNMRTLQECREACGGQGLKTENRIGFLKGEFDAQCTFEGDNNVLMQQVSKILLAKYVAAQKNQQPFKGLGLEYMNDSCPVIPVDLSSCILRSIKFQIDIFRLRKGDLLERFTADVSRYQSQGQSRENAINQVYFKAISLQKSYVLRAIRAHTILQAIIDAEMTLSTGPLKVGILSSMYALISTEKGSSFLQYGSYLSPGKYAAVGKEVIKL